MNRPHRSAALGEQLAAVLREQIVKGSLPDGTHLVEDQLATEHDVSRGPVRDALRTLLSEGLVESRRRGFYVRGFSAHDVDELYQVREAIEQLASALAIELTSGAGWGGAEQHLDRMREAADAGDDHGFAVADLAFHSEFYALSHNVRLQSLWTQFHPTFAAMLDVTNAQDKDLHPAYDDHRMLLQLAKERRTREFSLRLAEHLAGSRRRMSRALERQSEVVESNVLGAALP